MGEIDESQFVEDQDFVDESFLNNKLKLRERISRMSEEDRTMFYKVIQFDTMKQLIDSMKNLKKTSPEEWEIIISKLNIIKGIKNKDKTGFDFSKFVDKLIPLVGALAGTLIAMRESEKKDIEAAEPSYENNPLLNNPEFEKDAEEQLMKSIVLQYCNNKQNGFSL